MMYDPELVRPMREELTRLGAEELLTPETVDAWVADRERTGLLVVNSVCGCAAGMARPGVALAMQHPRRPERLATVFAGQDREATARARQHFGAIPPSSPSMALFRGGQLVAFLPRHRIEGRSAADVGRDLEAMFEQHLA
ncbi:MAG: BrxA/BrxB family bacilliredoxin [Planctomycetes bacterium]|nr:BrxA/BrxB family bacilliredoxin [Planctomycetota bacterium]